MSEKIIVKAFAVIDTNVIVSSMLGNKESATKTVMEYVSSGNIIPLFDRRMLDEYKDVLSRFFTDDIILKKIKDLVNNGYYVTNIEATRAFFKDKSDIPFFEVKESSKELDPYLITGNEKHYPEESTRSAAFVVDVMKYLNGFVIKDKEKYLTDFDKFIKTLDFTKYILGRETELLKIFEPGNYEEPNLLKSRRGR